MNDKEKKLAFANAVLENEMKVALANATLAEKRARREVKHLSQESNNLLKELNELKGYYDIQQHSIEVLHKLLKEKGYKIVKE